MLEEQSEYDILGQNCQLIERFILLRSIFEFDKFAEKMKYGKNGSILCALVAARLGNG